MPKPQTTATTFDILDRATIPGTAGTPFLYLGRAVGVHHTDTSDGSWDGPENEKRLPSPMPVGTARRAYAWIDDDRVTDGELPKDAARFIHHEVDGDGEPGEANVQACRSGIGVLNGGRGGTTIPDADRQGVYDHLAAHMRDADAEPPELQDADDEPEDAAPGPPFRAAQPTARQRPPAIDTTDAPRPVGADHQPSSLSSRRRRRDWYRIQNAADDPDTAEIYIYDEIVPPIISQFLEIGISAASFVRELQEHRGKTLAVHINSPGGVIFEALAIYNALRGHDGDVHVIVDGIAASSASVIAMAGDTVTMAPHSMLMIHEPYGRTRGNQADHEQQARVLGKIADDLAAVYRERGDKRRDWRALMREETWLTDEDAVKLGLADRIDTSATPAKASFDLSRFRNVPPDLQATAHGPTRSHAPTERDAERALRDAGLSARQAKAILAEGWADPDDDRDDPSPADPPVAQDGPGARPPTAAAAGTAAVLRSAEEIAAASDRRQRELELLQLIA